MTYGGLVREHYESFLLGLAGGSLTYAVWSGAYAWLLLTLFVFMGYIMCTADTLFRNMDACSHDIPLINLLDCTGEHLLFQKDGIRIYEKIRYINDWYAFVSETLYLDLHTYTPKENVVIAYPGVLYQKVLE